jgi:hypothetical protein
LQELRWNAGDQFQSFPAHLKEKLALGVGCKSREGVRMSENLTPVAEIEYNTRPVRIAPDVQPIERVRSK